MPHRQETASERRSHDVGAVLWSSFLAACLASLFFFARFDPRLLLEDALPPTWLADRQMAYTIGFFFFWAIGAVASGLTLWLRGMRR